MKDKEKQIYSALKFRFISGVVVIALAALMIGLNMHNTTEHVMEQASDFIQSAAEKSAENLDTIFANYKSSIKAIGILYGRLVQTSENADVTRLQQMTGDVRFDKLVYAYPDGRGISDDGQEYDFSDNSNFKKAVSGENGIAVSVADSNDIKNKLCFYAPVPAGGKIIGAIVGYLSDETVYEYMDQDILGYKSVAFLLSEDGTIVGSNTTEIAAETIGESLTETENDSKELAAWIYDSLKNHTSLVYSVKGINGPSKSYLTQLPESGFALVQTFPSQAVESMRTTVRNDNALLIAGLTALFACYTVLLVVIYRKKQKKIEQENRSFSNIITAVVKMFDRFALVDLDNNTYEYISTHESGILPDVESKGSYDKIRERIFSNCALHNSKNETMSPYTSPEALREALKDRDTLMFEYSEEFEQSKTFRWTNLSIICVERKNGVPSKLLMACKDETKLKIEEIRKREMLKDACRQAENASRAKSDFLSKMSHDIRTPMNAIVGMTALAGNYLDDKEKVKECLKNITSSSRHLLSLINEVLDMSRIESGKVVLAEEEFNISDLMESTLDMVRPSIKAKNQNFCISIISFQHENVMGDSLRLQKVFCNILNNANKYTPEKGTIRVTICEKPSGQDNVGCFEFVFEDNGIGMSEDFLKRIFIPFERAVDSRVDKIQGTGLGLAIASNIVNMMGGSLKAESKVGEGSRFTVTVLLKLNHKDNAPEKELAGKRVLIADDQQSACEAAKAMLDSMGMKAEWVTSGREAVQLVSEAHQKGEDYFAVIADLKMPLMDGIETARAIREKVGDSVPVIIASAFDWSDIEEEAGKAGVSLFISKPLFKTKLSAAFRNLLKSRERDNSLDGGDRDIFKGNRVLIAEDNGINAEIITEILTIYGIETDYAENGRIALEMIKEKPENYYGMVLMDIQMPEMNGCDACREIRKLKGDYYRNIPIVAITANAFAEDISETARAGMNAHLSKPIDIDSLKSTLSKYLK